MVMARIEQPDEPVQQRGEAGNRGRIDTVSQLFGVIEGGDAAVDLMKMVSKVSRETSERAAEIKKEMKGEVTLVLGFTAAEDGSMVLQVTKLDCKTPKVPRLKSRLFVDPRTGGLTLVDPKQQQMFDDRGQVRSVRSV